ncbi:MAG: hypothetical protein WKF87_06710 [Chryseolinea sp.]
MRRIYLPLIFLALLLSFGGGYWLGHSDVDGDAKNQVANLRRERGHLTTMINNSVKRNNVLQREKLQEQAKTARIDSIAGMLFDSKRAEAKKFESKIRKLQRATPPQLDTILTELYPKPRQSFNRSLRPIAVSEWRVMEIAQDNHRLDSIRVQSGIQERILGMQHLAIASRDTRLFIQEKQLEEKDTTISLLVKREGTYAQEAVVFQTQAKKYKRQRNGAIAGGVTTVLAVLAKIVFFP